MNNQQKRYLIQRLDDIAQSKINSIVQENWKMNIKTVIQNNNLKIRPYTEILKRIPDQVRPGGIPCDCVFDGYSETVRKIDSDFQKRTDAVKTEKIKVVDSILLGDDSDILNVLAEFEDKKF